MISTKALKISVSEMIPVIWFVPSTTGRAPTYGCTAGSGGFDAVRFPDCPDGFGHDIADLKFSQQVIGLITVQHTCIARRSRETSPSVTIPIRSPSLSVTGMAAQVIAQHQFPHFQKTLVTADGDHCRCHDFFYAHVISSLAAQVGLADGLTGRKISRRPTEGDASRFKDVA